MGTEDSDRKNDRSESVVTPGGPRARALVHPVGPTEGVYVHESGAAAVVALDSVSQSKTRKDSVMTSDVVLTPGGFRHRSLVHHVEDGHALQAVEGRMRLKDLASDTLRDIPEPASKAVVPALGSGWITYAYWNNGSGAPISVFTTTWEVPPAPKTLNGQTIFLFNGIQNYGANFGILQPVLQFGQSAAGGGNFWSIANWYVTSGGQAFFSTLVPVNVGDVLVGVMTLTGQTGTTFNYNSTFQGITSSTLVVQNIAELLWCNETLEAYGVQVCSDYPATGFTRMRGVGIQTGTARPRITWTPVNRVTDCGQHTMVVSDSATEGEVDLYYHPAIIQIPFDKYAELVQILFGVTNDGGGIVIVGGHIIRVPPWGPGDPVFSEAAKIVTEIARGVSIYEVAKGSANSASRNLATETGLKMTANALEAGLTAVKQQMAG
jgi:hypothetical protein